jgi:hypothetical protein
MPTLVSFLPKNDGKHLTRNQLEFASLVIYAVVIAVAYTIAVVVMLLGSGAAQRS